MSVILAILYGVIVLALFLGQRQLLFHPTKADLQNLEIQAKTEQFEPWHTPSGQIIGWKRLSKIPGIHHRALVTHGNAGCALDRTAYADLMATTGNWDVYILEYPGYGAREGTPSLDSFCQAAKEAMELLEKEGPVHLIGESIGTGVASWLAGTHPQTTAGVLLVAPYDDLGNVAQAHMPVFPVKWILKDRFTSAEYLKNYHGPLAVLLAGHDEVVPNRLGYRLYNSYTGPKKVWISPNATHNSLIDMPQAWWKTLVEFWNQTKS